MVNILGNSTVLNDIIDCHPKLVIFALDKEYRYIAFNSPHSNIMVSIWGKKIELGVSMLDYIHLEEDLIKAKSNFDRALKGDTFTLIEEYGEKSLNRLYYKDTYYPLINSENQIYGLCVVVEDVTISYTNKEEVDRIKKQLENQIKSRTQELETINENLIEENRKRINTENELQSVKLQIEKALADEMELNKLKTKFISMVSHEFRTPLTIIQTASFLLQKSFERNDEEKFYKNLDKVNKSIDSMTELIESVLNIGKLEHGEIKASYSVFNLKEELEDIKKSNKNFVIFVKLKLPDKAVFVDSDKVLFRQIINNLLTNALKYSNTNPKIKLNMIADEYKSTITISDNGIGIADENINQLTEPFKREDKISSVIQGTGLGLSIVKHNLDLIGGTLNIQSELDIGTKVTITIPR